MANEQFIIFKSNKSVIISPPETKMDYPHMVLTEYREDLLSGEISVSGFYGTAQPNNGEPSGQIDVINFGNIDITPIKDSKFTHRMSIQEYIALATSVDTSTGVNIWERHRIIKINGVKHILGVNPQYGLLATDWELLEIVENAE